MREEESKMMDRGSAKGRVRKKNKRKGDPEIETKSHRYNSSNAYTVNEKIFVFKMFVCKNLR